MPLRHSALLAVLNVIGQEGDWATTHRSEAARVLEQALKVSPKAAKQTSDHKPVEKILPLESRVLSDMQSSADWMLAQKVIPKRVDVASAVCPKT